MLKTCLPISHLIEKGSPSARELMKRADVLEFRRPFLLEKFRDKPAVFHSGLGLVQAEFVPAFQREGLAEFLKEIRAELFSFDLGPACRKNFSVLPLSRTLTPDQIKKETGRALDYIRRFYSGPLAAENYNYYPTGLYESVCRPDFIGTYLEEFELGLVLDLAHAAISAVNLKIDLQDYLGELPLERTMEVHLSRPYFHPRMAVDAHAGPRAEDFDRLAFVIKRLPKVGSVLVALEYYRDLKRMKNYFFTLEKLIEELNLERNSVAFPEKSGRPI